MHPKRIFSTNSRSFGQLKKRRKDTVFHPPSPFHGNFFNCNSIGICRDRGGQKMTQRHFFPTLHPLSLVIYATSTMVAFVRLRNSWLNFHCYIQREATPAQKLAQKCAATSRKFLHERLQSAFTLANQLRCIAQYSGFLDF